MGDGKETGARTATILLVDDVPSNLWVLYETLNGRGYRLLVATDGAQALQIAARAQPELILLDVMMPGMDGFEVCRRLKADPQTRAAAVIFLSALDEAADKVQGLELGAVDYVTKPFHPEEVAARVATHCRLLELERSLAQQNRQLELVRDRILNAMTEGVVGLDETGRSRFVNAAAERMLGLPASVLLARGVADWEPASLRAALGRVLGGREELIVETIGLPRAEGTPMPAELRVAAVRADGRIAGAVLVLQDLSEREHAQAALLRTSDELRASHRALKEAQLRLIQADRLESVGRLAAGVAHEVKNPLQIVQLGLDWLAQVLPLGDLERSVFADIQQAVTRADTVIRGLLNFSRARPLALAPDSLNRIVKASLSLTRHAAAQQGVTVAVQLAEPLPQCPFDADKMQQVVLNLLMNALQAMGSGGRLSVTTAVHVLTDEDLTPAARACGFLAGDRVIRLLVEDTGPGIRQEHLGRLFDPYFTTKPQGQGTGLGLAVARTIVTLHGGSIDLDNRPGGGARATLLFRPTEETVAAGACEKLHPD